MPALLCTAAFAACGPRVPELDTDPVVARAYSATLRRSELRTVVPMDASPEDSAAIAQRFVGNWLRQQVVLHKAEENLGEPDKEFSDMLREYRNSLVIYAFERAVVDRNLDTRITDAEIEEHLNANPGDFELAEDLVRARWFKVKDDDRRVLKRLEEHFLSGSVERMGQLENWLAQHGVPITDRTDRWMAASELIEELPIAAPGALATGRRTFRDDGTLWFLEVTERRTKGETAPLERVRDDIRAILINLRKLRLIERMREDLYREALENGSVQLP